MGIPLITSIWRGIAEIDDSLNEVWNLAKPIYMTGEPEYIYKNMFHQINLYLPKELNFKELKKNHLNQSDLKDIKHILKVYNRSNTMNLITLSALVNVNFSYDINLKEKKQTSLSYKLPELLEKNKINKKTWKIIKHVNSYGASNGQHSHVATLWRHLAHWPNFLLLIDKNLRPLNENGIINQSLETVLNYVNDNGIILNKNTHHNNINKLAKNIISNYVESKHQVVRMVALGNIIEKWIGEVKC